MTTQGGSYSWNATCDVCGFQYKGKELKKRWDGLLVCEADFENRHPLDFYKVKNDHHPLPFTRQDPLPAMGFLPELETAPSSPEQVTSLTAGSKFTVGGANRKLRGIRFGGMNTAGWYIVSPVLVKLWTNTGTLLYTWTIQNLRYLFTEADGFSIASANLLPAYTLEASTAYRISVYLESPNGIPGTTAITSVQDFMTYNSSYSDLSDAFPDTAMTGGKATPYIDVITSSDN